MSYPWGSRVEDSGKCEAPAGREAGWLLQETRSMCSRHQQLMVLCSGDCTPANTCAQCCAATCSLQHLYGWISAPRLIFNHFWLTLRVTSHSVTWGRALQTCLIWSLCVKLSFGIHLMLPNAFEDCTCLCAWHSSLKNRPILHLPAISISFVYLFCRLFKTWTLSPGVHVRHAKLQDFDLVFSH